MSKKGIKVTDKKNQAKNKMQSKNELLSIAQLESTYFRKKALEEWWDAWIIEIEADQLILDHKYINSEHQDLIKERLMLNCLEDSIEKTGTYEIQDKKLVLKFQALRRKK